MYFPPISSNSAFNVQASEISGIPPIVTEEFAKIDAGIKATALFFAPLTCNCSLIDDYAH